MQLSLLDQLPASPLRSVVGAHRVHLAGGAWIEHLPGWMAGHRQLFEKLQQTAQWERHRRQMYDRLVDVPRLVANLPGDPVGIPFNGESHVEVHRASIEPSTATGPSSAIGLSSAGLSSAIGLSTAVEPSSAAGLSCLAGGALLVADELRGIAHGLSRDYSRVLTSITLAYYRDGRDSVAYHGDKMGALRQDTIVAILSLGACRRFLMRPLHGGPASGARSFGFTVGEGDLVVMGGSAQATWEHAVPKQVRAGPRISVMFRQQLPRSGG